ncbi:MAG: M56 family metallopeptidase, partial [Bacteroidales bacterium]|nr:M56 family metallopeptidase [Bacteroidales bacterium]
MQNLLSEKLTYALGMMLLHFVWQGVCVAVFLAMVLVVFRKSSPQSRYNVSVVALLLFPLLTVATLFYHLNAYDFMVESGALQLGGGDAKGGSVSILDRIIALYVNYLPIIVAVWLFGMIVMLLRSLGNLIIIQRLKSYYLRSLSDELKEKITYITTQMSLKRKVKAFISEKAGTPMIIGHFKPVLLLPSTAVHKLSNDELDVVLQHELAHVKRNDYLVNILQISIEILFFFHPATWWISNIIRREREECCDMYAIREEKDKILLAKALTSIQEMQLETPSFAMSLLGNRNNLLKRIKNMFKNRPVIPSFKEGVIVALFFVVSIGLMSFVVKGTDAEEEKQQPELRTINGQMSNGDHLFAKVDDEGSIHKLYVEGKKVNKRKYIDYQALVDSMAQPVKPPKPPRPARPARPAKPARINDVNVMTNGTPEPPLSPEELEEIQVELEEELAELAEELKEMDVEELHMAKEVSEQMGGIFEEVFREVNEELKKEFGEDFDMNFNINIDEDGEKVKMSMGENGFHIDVDEGDEKVKLSFDENGMYINVVENGKNTVNMQIGVNGA